MIQQKEDFIRSEVAVDVLRYIAEREEGSYSTEIAHDLEKTQSSISRILSNMKEKGAVKKGKRNRAQYYEIDFEGLTNYWFENISEWLQEDNEESETELFYDVSEEFEAQEKEIKEFTKEYFQIVLPKSEEMDLYSLLFTSYAVSLSFINASFRDSDSWEFPEYLQATNRALIEYIDIKSFHTEIAVMLRIMD